VITNGSLTTNILCQLVGYNIIVVNVGGGPSMTGGEPDYSVIEGLKHIRYDFEDSRSFMNRVMPSLMNMRKKYSKDIYKWQVIEAKYDIR